MLIVGNSIVSDDIADQRFCCNLSRCHGACCVEGDSGAPLLEEEVPLLEALLPHVMPLLSPEGRAAIERQGVAVRDNDGDLGTPLVDGGTCAYAIQEDNLTLCALEKYHSSIQAFKQSSNPAFKQSSNQAIKQSSNQAIPKPISCHLYPIRIQDYGEFTAVNYHRWNICRDACGHGEPLYIALRAPLIRRFGQDWYNELLQEIKNRNNE